MPSRTGMQLQAFIVRTEKMGGPKGMCSIRPNDPSFNDALHYWVAVAEFWGDKYDEIEAMLATSVELLARQAKESPE